ncbi:hypothetical protein BKA65DRAFT_553795 [Rhexocercosporidium sp. MPI-PUGE-AT-0058]|nr:hypothetical protein BKA65DRAFT_553795 [Rhexocercosporidium sp. MPI-PUGE-AT-0058]
MSSDTIEPALLARVQDELYSYEQLIAEPSSSTAGQLPPLREVVGHDVSTRRNDNSKHNEQSTTSSQFPAQGNCVTGQINSQENAYQNGGTQQAQGKGITNRALGDSSPQSLRKILDNDTETTVGGSSKKRPIAEPVKDDFVQLPQPPKKRKTATQIVPPIIIGLHDIPAPKDLVRFNLPRIESGAFRDSNGRNSLNAAPPTTIVPNAQNNPEVGIVVDSIETQEPPPKPAKKKRNTSGLRRKWEKDETEWLIQGAHKHGVGNWTDIVKDPEYSFQGRSASALKDRFRTVCPSGVLKDLERRTLSPGEEKTASKSPKSQSRAHRKDVDDLAKLGIETPFKKSDRRERKPFTEEEDREILRAYRMFGNQWARMTREKDFNLHERTSTDIRDRYRNIMKSIERGSPPRSASKNLAKPRSNDALSSGHPSSSSLFIPAQDPLALQSSTLNSGEPRNVEGLSSSHPSSSDLFSQNQAWSKETNQDFRNKDGLPNGQLPSFDPSFQAQGLTNKANEPWMKESNHHSGSSRSKNDLSNGYQQLPELDLRAMTLNRPDEPWPKEPQAPTVIHQTSGLRIQEIICPEQEDSRSSTLFGFSTSYNPYPEHHLEPPEPLSYSQSAPFDWNSTIAAPFTQNLPQGMPSDMDINRLLHTEDQWATDMATSNVQGMEGKEKQSITNINSILSSNDDPVMSNQPSFLTMLNADGPLGMYD